jgi:putative ABC transport system permease protein
MIQDFKFAFRTLAKRPGFTSIIVLTLALGIGANCTIFSLVDGLLLKPLPYPEADRLVWLAETNSARGYLDSTVSPLNYRDWREQSRSLESLSAYTLSAFNSQDERGVAQRVIGARVSEDFFRTLGVPLMTGSASSFAEEGSADSVILSESFWRQRFHADPGTIGSSLRMDGEVYQVVGVMSDETAFPPRAELWVPLRLAPDEMVRNDQYLRVIGRLAPISTLEQARSELETVGERLAEQYPESNTGWSVAVTPLQERLFRKLRAGLLILLGAVGMVLLIACVNVANLLLARAKTREREIALRTTLGASKGLLLRQLVAESAVLSLAGSALGLFLASLSLDLVRGLIPLPTQDLARATLDFRVLLFALLLAVVTSVIFGLAPLIQSLKSDLVSALKAGSKGSSEGFRRHTLTGSLVIGEVALAMVLAISAVLLLQSFGSLSSEPPGFNSERLLTMRLTMNGTSYETDEERSRLIERLTDEIGHLPGVGAVGATDLLPLAGGQSVVNFHLQGETYAPGEEPEAHIRTITPGYFRAMEIPLIAGRDISERDRADVEGVVVVNQTMAERFWPDRDPLGQHIDFGSDDGSTPPAYRVIGIVGDVRHGDLGEASGPEMYFSNLQGAAGTMYLVLRTSGDPNSLTGPVRDTVARLAPEVPLYAIQSMDEIIEHSLANERFQIVLMASFAGLALVLAAIGIFGLVSYSVNQARRDIGIRMAIGARPLDILHLVLFQGFRLGLFGVVIGLPLAFFGTRALKQLLFEVEADDPGVFVGIAIMVLLVSLFSASWPAWRASKVSPLVTLQGDS